MDKDNLVILRGRSILVTECGTKLEPKKDYRHMAITENGVTEHLVYGIKFDDQTFKQLFVYLYDALLVEWTENGLYPNGKVLSKSAFVKLLNVHTYGGGKNKLFLGFVGNKSIGMVSFQPLFKGDTKSNYLSHAYSMYVDTINGNMRHIDEEMVQRGNNGIPLTFGDIYFRVEDYELLRI